MRHGVVGPAFHPAGALAVVVDAVVVGVGGGGGFEGPGFFDGFLVGLQKGCVATGAIVVAHGHQEERGGVGGGVLVGEGFPVYRGIGGGLGKLVHNLAVGALATDKEL